MSHEQNYVTILAIYDDHGSQIHNYLNNKTISTTIKKSQQQINTSQIGQCKVIKLTKGADGFGFSYAGRMNAKEEHLYCVKGVRRDQGLSIGDRILQIDGIDLACLDQGEVTLLLKSKPVGGIITMLISRIEQETDHEILTPLKEKNEPEQLILEKENKQQELLEGQKVLDTDTITNIEQRQLLCFDIPLNETPGAGLGISVKAQRVGDKDMGLYVRSILHGSAAYKDGRLCINDHLVGIETENLMKYTLNGEALNAFIHTLAHLSPNKAVVRIYVERNKQMFSNHISRRGSDSELSQTETHSFVRDTAARRSISEKRPLGLHKDPTNLRTYQRIIHQRQTVAPELSLAHRSRRSLHEPILKSEQNKTQLEINRNRPTTAFYVDLPNFSQMDPFQSLNFNSGNHHRYCSSNLLPLPLEKQAQKSTISSSKSQPEILTSGVSIKNNDEEIYRPSKRRSSLGTGLLKFFSKNLHKQDQLRQQDCRSPPPPYKPLPSWQHNNRQAAQSFCTNQQNKTYKIGTNNDRILHEQNFSFRSNQHLQNIINPPIGYGPAEGVHHCPPDTIGMQLRNQQKQLIENKTTTSHSISGSPLDPRQPDSLADFDQPQQHHELYWHSLPRERRNNQHDNNNSAQFGRIQPSAVFYDDSCFNVCDANSHWVIRC